MILGHLIYSRYDYFINWYLLDYNNLVNQGINHINLDNLKFLPSLCPRDCSMYTLVSFIEDTPKNMQYNFFFFIIFQHGIKALLILKPCIALSPNIFYINYRKMIVAILPCSTIRALNLPCCLANLVSTAVSPSLTWHIFLLDYYSPLLPK